MTEPAAGGDPSPPPPPPAPSGGRAATLVAAGILLSRVFGLVRQRVIGHYLGAGNAADAFTIAFRIPNILQNLLGEGVLSASFIPVYARLRARGDDEGRRAVAASVLALLLVATSLLVLAGVLLAPAIVAVMVPRWTPEQRALTTVLVRILFPGAAIFVLSAWTLGVLNTHGRFFLSYASGVVWNIAMIATLIAFGPRSSDDRLVVLLAWGSVVGAFLQFVVQLPAARAALGWLRLHWDLRSTAVRTVLRTFGPIFIGRGVTQISSLVDAFLAGLVGVGGAAILGYAQAITLLPVSLFGMSVTAAELPAMASVIGGEEEVAAALRRRLETGLRRIAFFVVPSAVAFLAVGDQIVQLIYRGGRFGPAEVQWVWAVMGGAAIGLLASTLGRLYSSAFYALHDSRTPLRFAVARVSLSTVLGATLVLLGPRALGIDPRWGVAGVTLASGSAGWVEYHLLRRALSRRVGVTGIGRRVLLVLWSGAALAGLIAFAANWANRTAPPIIRALLVLGVFGMVYWVYTWRAGIPEAVQLREQIFRRGRKKKR